MFNLHSSSEEIENLSNILKILQKIDESVIKGFMHAILLAISGFIIVAIVLGDYEDDVKRILLD